MRTGIKIRQVIFARILIEVVGGVLRIILVVSIAFNA